MGWAGELILPPRDIRERSYIDLDDKSRAKEMKDGGAIAQQWWAKVDCLLFGDQHGEGAVQVMARYFLLCMIVYSSIFTWH